ncbi:hypothetical protein [Serratia fonticola]|uniref:hypothetical protein n=1 Tax=Serratia fonticola TaxID=47917 RepID=UPI0034C65851
MNEQLVNQLIEALAAETAAKKEQTAAINRLAESNESLVAMLYDSLTDEADDAEPTTYMSGKPRG